MSTQPDIEPSAAGPTERARFEALVLAHQAAIWRYLRFLGCAPDDANELVQETFLAVYGKEVDRFGGDGARAYLRRVARNLRLKALRRQEGGLRSETDGALDLDRVIIEGDAAYDWQRGEDEGAACRAALDACLRELAPRARRALELRYDPAGPDRAAIAAQLGLSSHGVKSLLQRSYARLRICIERRLRREEER